ncbi:ribonuclease H-like domain-containing protein [Priestia filamentosa]|uniref:ribonuclease H-like domain-containing protein n=1 Tax=Priestia filamentosa TaxID=1402861 RepID=UPI0002E8C6C8|nr:ribonuclease H-like domain-containing protein [Priestia filamentosa]
MSLKNKLARMKSHLNVEEGKEKPKLRPPVQSIPYLDEWENFNTTVYKGTEGFCLIREVKYPLDYKHGLYTFKELTHVIEGWNATDYHHPLSSKGYSTSELFFFDTETTGLSTGAGTTIFLLGYARVERDGVIFRQHVLPDQSGEIAFYESFLQEVNYEALVTYNGKSFDWPMVKTRHTLLREHLPKLPSFGHFDLLHASRRLWKRKLESVKLVNVEKEILNIERHDDIPGFLAPMIYFDYVETKKTEGLMKVMQHNEQDILSLITLYIHLSKHLLQNVDRTSTESYEVARWYEALGEKERAVRQYEEVIGGEDEEAEKALFALGIQAKREKEWEKSRGYFGRIKRTRKLIMQAQIELAKLYEHQFKEIKDATFYAEKAYSYIDETTNERLKQELEKRLKRLREKVAL